MGTNLINIIIGLILYRQFMIIEIYNLIVTIASLRNISLNIPVNAFQKYDIFHEQIDVIISEKINVHNIQVPGYQFLTCVHCKITFNQCIKSSKRINLLFQTIIL